MGARICPDGSNLIRQKEQQIHRGWEQYLMPSLRELMLNHRLIVEQLSQHHYLMLLVVDLNYSGRIQVNLVDY